MEAIIVCKCKAQLILDRLTPLFDGKKAEVICGNCGEVIELPPKLAKRFSLVTLSKEAPC